MAGITGFHLRRATKWCPAANCMIEKLHQYLTARLLCHTHEYWAEALLLVFTGILNAWKKALKASSAELVYEKPCLFRQYSSPSQSPTTPTLLTSKPGYGSTSGSSNLIGVQARQATSSSYLRIQQKHRTSAYEKTQSLEPCKACMLAHAKSSVGVIQPMQSASMASRQQYSFTA